MRTSPWIEEFFALAKSLGAEAMNFTRLIPSGAGAKLVAQGCDQPLTPPNMKSAYEKIIAASKVTGIKTTTNAPLFHLVDTSLGAASSWLGEAVVVDYRGRMKFASRIDLLLGDARNGGMRKIFLSHPVLRALRNGVIDACGKCALKNRCGGDRVAAYAAFGSVLARDPGCWLSLDVTPQRASAST